MFKVVEFEDASLGIIRQEWLTPRKRQCLWPPHKLLSKYNKSLLTQAVPDDDWAVHAIRRTFYETDDISKARQKCKKAESESELASTDIEVDTAEKWSRKRKVRPRKIDSDADDYEESDDECQIKYPIPPKSILPPPPVCIRTCSSPRLLEDFNVDSPKSYNPTNEETTPTTLRSKHNQKTFLERINASLDSPISSASHKLTGVVLLLCGVSVLVIYKEYDLFITQRFHNVPSFAIATGTIIIVSSALGFYAALSQDFHYVAAYVAVSVLVLIFEMSAVIVSYGLLNNVASDIRRSMAATLPLYNQRQEITAAWDSLQMEFECCGVSGRHDWSPNLVPVSCCHIDVGTVSPFVCNQANAYTTSCATALSDWLSNNAYGMAVTTVVVLCLQILNTAAACWLAYRSKYEEVELES